MKIVLLVGVLDDPALVYIARYLSKTKIPIVFLDQNEMGKKLFCNTKGWHFQDSWKIEHKNIIAVYNRMANLDYHKATLLQISTYESLMFLLDNIYPNVINRPKYAISNFSKMGQLIDLPLKHLKCPESILQSFSIYNNNTIYKSASNQRSIVKPVSKTLKAGPEPVLYQKKISGVNIRVHVLKDQYVATKITAKSIDYRYCNSRQFSMTKLPTKIANECININKHLQFILCGIDLIYSKNQWFILEANPSPGFNFFEKNTNNTDTTKLLINFLRELL